jgi:hypothetical protein
MPMKKRVDALPFRQWLLQQVHRTDAVGRLARDVASEEKRIGTELNTINDRPNLALYARAIPTAGGVTVADALAALREWAALGIT